jgi:DNA-binding PadR family transcriptional regulator
MPIDFNGLDTAVHGPLRLGILAVLQVDGPLDFTTLKKRLRVSDGAIGPHLLKLEEIGYLTSTKAFVGRRPRTTYRISAAGSKALAHYLDQMQAIIDAIRGASDG